MSEVIKEEDGATTDEKVDLKDCPFCGCEAELVKVPVRIHGKTGLQQRPMSRYVQCSGCGTRSDRIYEFELNESMGVVEKWNKRHMSKEILENIAKQL